ncbi:uncharacterized [Tachysurus ichikawai]
MGQEGLSRLRRGANKLLATYANELASVLKDNKMTEKQRYVFQFEGDKHPPPAAWTRSPIVTPRGRLKILQNSPLSEKWHYFTCFCSFILSLNSTQDPRSVLRLVRDEVQLRASPSLVLILSRFCRVGSAQNGGLRRLLRMRGTQGGGGDGEEGGV